MANARQRNMETFRLLSAALDEEAASPSPSPASDNSKPALVAAWAENAVIEVHRQHAMARSYCGHAGVRRWIADCRANQLLGAAATSVAQDPRDGSVLVRR